MTDKEKISLLHEEFLGELPSKVEPLAGGGSSRRYYRVSEKNGSSLVVAVCDNPVETDAFISLSSSLVENGIKVPQVLWYDKEINSYLLEDLGDKTLFAVIKREYATPLITKSIEQLVKFQTLPESLWRGSLMNGVFGKRQIMWDLNYFKYCFLKPAAITFNEEKLEDDFERFANTILPFPEDTMGLMYRDFQSRNVMIKDGAPVFIDYQGAWKGPLVYDIVSFLWQAKANYSQEIKENALNYYFKEMASQKSPETIEIMRRQVLSLAFFRTFQVLGAYGLRGLIEKKAHFIESIPLALENLRNLLDANPGFLGEELEGLCRKLLALNRFNTEKSEGLTITVFSFSYKKGYPEDTSGNGGGYMFDCRGMENPGRYKEFKKITGRDKPVIDFLESVGEVQRFVSNAIEVVKPSIRNYISRGFNSLQIGFGCTGGQHRSVYCADRMAEYLRKSFPETKIRLIHREQGIEE